MGNEVPVGRARSKIGTDDFLFVADIMLAAHKRYASKLKVL